MRVRYLRDVDIPDHLSGKALDVRDLDEWYAKQLLDEGFAELHDDGVIEGLLTEGDSDTDVE